MSTFDDLLKKGKQVAIGNETEEEKWKSLVTTIMHAVHQLNGMYKNEQRHHLKIETTNCQSCSEATFILAVRSLNNSGKPIRFHRAKWKYLKPHTYLCDRCQKK